MIAAFDNCLSTTVVVASSNRTSNCLLRDYSLEKRGMKVTVILPTRNRPETVGAAGISCEHIVARCHDLLAGS